MGKFWLILILGLSAGGASAAPPAPSDQAYSAGDRMNINCFKPLPTTEAAEQKLKDLNFKIEGNLSPEAKAEIPAILSRIEDLAGQNNLIKDVDLKVVSNSKDQGLQNCQGDHKAATADHPETIDLNPTCPNGVEGVAETIEYNLGQVVESKLNLSKSYAATKVCDISKFSEGRSRDVEFAEVFASYLSSPNVLRTRCPDQFKWMKDNVFPKGEAEKNCSSNPDRAPPPVAQPSTPNTPNPPSPPPTTARYQPSPPAGSKNGMGNQMDALLPLLQALATQPQNPVAPPRPAATLVPIETIYVTPQGPVTPWGANTPFVAH